MTRRELIILLNKYPDNPDGSSPDVSLEYGDIDKVILETDTTPPTIIITVKTIE